MEALNKIITEKINDILPDFKIINKRLGYLDGIYFARYRNDIIEYIVFDFQSEKKNELTHLIVNFTIRYNELEDKLAHYLNEKNSIETIYSLKSNSSNTISFHDLKIISDSNITIIIDMIDQQLKEKAFPYFEEYQNLQDVNDKIFPRLEKAPDGIPFFSFPFLRDYSNEKALIVLKLCNNSYFKQYYNWYKELVEELIEEPQESWEIDYRVFQELDRTFLSK